MPVGRRLGFDALLAAGHEPQPEAEEEGGMKRKTIAVALICMMTTLPALVEARSVKMEGPDQSTTYKVVFDLNSAPSVLDEVDPGLQAVADLLAQYASHGVNTSHRRFVVVLHAATTDLALDAAFYERLHTGRANRNIAMMRDLVAKGVRFVVSQQSLAIRSISPDAIQRFVRIGPTANLVFIDLEAEGYVFTTTTSLVKE